MEVFFSQIFAAVESSLPWMEQPGLAKRKTSFPVREFLKYDGSSLGCSTSIPLQHPKHLLDEDYQIRPIAKIYHRFNCRINADSFFELGMIELQRAGILYHILLALPLVPRLY